MFLDTEENEQEERIEEEKITCPECGKEFQDMRGLTSHARHMHKIGKEELNKLIKQEDDNRNMGWKIIGGIGASILALITLGRSK